LEPQVLRDIDPPENLGKHMETYIKLLSMRFQMVSTPEKYIWVASSERR
jgi:hypothetical protein